MTFSTHKTLLLFFLIAVSGVCKAETYTLGDFILKPQKGLELSYQTFPGQTDKVLVGWKDYELGFYLSSEAITSIGSTKEFWQQHKIFDTATNDSSIEIIENGELKLSGGLVAEFKLINFSHKGSKANQIVYVFLNDKHAFSATITFLDKKSGEKVLKETNRLFKKSKLTKKKKS